MLNISSIDYMHCENVQELIGVSWLNCEFAQMAEDGSYQHIWCDSDAVAEAKEEYEDELASWSNITREDFDDDESYERWNRTSSVARLRNQYLLIKALNELGYNEMLILCSY